MSENWKGGMLLIDELDATLHPSAQVKLFQYLLESSKELGLQVCFTTHSLYLLEYTIKKAERSGKEGSTNGEIEVNYLAPEGEHVKATRNPSYDEMKYDLMMLLPPENIGVKIKAYVEDDEAFVFASALLRKYEERIEILSVELGCDNLIKLFEKDDNFRNSLIILDGDAKEKIKGIDINLRAAAQKTIIALPGWLDPEEYSRRTLSLATKLATERSTDFLQKNAVTYWKKNDDNQLSVFIERLTSPFNKKVPWQAMQDYFHDALLGIMTTRAVFRKNDLLDTIILCNLQESHTIITYDGGMIKRMEKRKDEYLKYKESLDLIYYLKS